MKRLTLGQRRRTEIENFVKMNRTTIALLRECHVYFVITDGG